MAKFYPQLNEEHIAFMRKQAIFFTATACPEGHINLSPKGMDTLRVLDNNTVAYLDLTGSGNESSAHLAKDGRMTMMLCSFDEQPLIFRLFGRGEVVLPHDPQWLQLSSHFTLLPGTRQIIVLHVNQVQTSCGYAVPRYQLVEERQTLLHWAEKKGDDGIREYWHKNNMSSIDGYPSHLALSPRDK